MSPPNPFQGCKDTATIAVTSTCLASTQAQLYCSDVSCTGSDAVNLTAAGCTSPLLTGDASLVYSSDPLTCPSAGTSATVAVNLTVGSCTYSTSFAVASWGCSPGQYPSKNGTCTDCGYGYYCPDSQQQLACPDWETTNTTTATSAGACYIASCSVCTDDASPEVYFTTGSDMGIWRTDSFTPGGQIDKMCAFPLDNGLFATINGEDK